MGEKPNQSAAIVAGGDDVLSQADIAAILAQPDAPAAPVDGSIAAPKPTEPPLKLVIGGEEITTAEQVQAKIEQAKTEALASAADDIRLGQLFRSLEPDHQQYLASIVEKIQKGLPMSDDGGRELVVSEIDVPTDARVPNIDWADLPAEGQYLYALISGVRTTLDAKITELGNIVAGMRQFVSQAHAAGQDEKIAQALRAVGFEGYTSDHVRALRVQGIADPIKAFEAGILAPPKKVEAAKPEESAPGETPPEGTRGGSQRYFDSDDPGLSLDQINRLLKAGYLPKNPKEREKLLKERVKAG